MENALRQDRGKVLVAGMKGTITVKHLKQPKPPGRGRLYDDEPTRKRLRRMQWEMNELAKKPRSRRGNLALLGRTGCTIGTCGVVLNMQLNKTVEAILKHLIKNASAIVKPNYLPCLNSCRSFQAVGVSAISNDGQSETSKFNNCEATPTFEGGDKQRNGDSLRGAVLPAGSKWLLITASGG